jgi:hypothetical protein
MVEMLRHSQTKGRDNRKLKHRPKQARLSSTLQGSRKTSGASPASMTALMSLLR